MYPQRILAKWLEQKARNLELTEKVKNTHVDLEAN